MITKIAKAAFAGLTLSILFTGYALATPDHVRFIKYSLLQNGNGSFQFAWNALSDLYKDTQYEQIDDSYHVNPLIGVGEIDLNGDKIAEIIAYPVEEEVEVGKFCQGDSVCPHYILEIRKNGVHQLGRIFASSIDRGDSITDGYWDLKVYSGDWKDPPDGTFSVYTFSKRMGRYVLSAKQPHETVGP